MRSDATITFSDKQDSFHIYQRFDCSPEAIRAKLNDLLVRWPLSRCGVGELAAAYVATQKKGSGNIQLATGPSQTTYHYKVHQDKSGRLTVKAFRAELSPGGGADYPKIDEWAHPVEVPEKRR